MDWAAERQKVLAQNVANADTPDYQAKDLKKLDFRRVLNETTAPVQVARTNPQHLPGTIPQQERFEARKPVRPYEESPDKNQVVLEDQMEKIGQARSDYNTAVTLMQSQMKMLSTAIGKGSSGS
jgi:flagellar basal-body rod protein FlgB